MLLRGAYDVLFMKNGRDTQTTECFLKLNRKLKLNKRENGARQISI